MKNLLWIFFAVPLAVSSQIDPTTFDYSRADSVAINFPQKKYKSYTELVAPLTESFTTDHEKLRVLFRWITENIQYNYGNPTTNADNIVKRKKAICIGYSTLLKEMCNSAGIECEIIIGYTKRTIEDIDRKLNKTDHAWNAVKLYGKWYLLDATWAVGYWDEKKRKVIKDYNQLYFLTPPEIFIKDHFPKDKKWQMLDKPIKKSQFIKPPIFYSSYFKEDFSQLEPKKGIIKIHVSDTLLLKFFSKTKPESATIELGDKQFIYHPVIEKRNDYTFIKQKFEKPGRYKLTLFLDGYGIAAYRLIIQ